MVGAGGQWYLISIIVSYRSFPSSFAKFFLRYRLGFSLFLQLLETRRPIFFTDFMKSFPLLSFLYLFRLYFVFGCLSLCD